MSNTFFRQPLDQRITPAVLAVARALHDLWRERMDELGWVEGPGVDEELMTHPGLKDFDELDPLDERLLVESALMMAAGRNPELGLDRPRGANREFTALDIREGLRVREGDRQGPFEGEEWRGEIVSWTVGDRPPLLDDISVRINGHVVVYYPCMCDLYRESELAGGVRPAPRAASGRA